MTDMEILCDCLIETSEKILLNYKANKDISLIEKQAKALEEKDKYISELEERLKKYESTNVTLEIKDTEQIIGFSPTQSKTPKPPSPMKISLDDDIKLKRVKHNKIRYYVISGESPQLLYEILDNGERGKKVGKRSKTGKNYEYQLDK